MYFELRSSETLSAAVRVSRECDLIWGRAVIIPVLDPNPDSELRQFWFISQFQTPVHKDPIPLMDPNPGLQRILSCSRLVQIHLDISELYYKIFF